MSHQQKRLKTIGKWCVGAKLGSGASAYVYKCTRLVDEKNDKKITDLQHTGATCTDKSLDTQSVCALKCVRRSRLNEVTSRQLQRELAALKTFCHPNIVSLCDETEVTPRHVCFPLEFCNSGDLGAYIHRQAAAAAAAGSGGDDVGLHGLSLDVTQHIFVQICGALLYIHEKGSSHRDLKPDNILLHRVKLDSNEAIPNASDSDSKHTPAAAAGTGTCQTRLIAKISDLGFVRGFMIQDLEKTRCGTPGYVAPEVMFSGKYSQAVDLWSLGMILFVMLHGTLPLELRTRNIGMFYRTLLADPTKRIRCSDKLPSDIYELLQSMLCVDPQQRVTIQQVMQHPWVESGLQQLLLQQQLYVEKKDQSDDDNKVTADQENKAEYEQNPSLSDGDDDVFFSLVDVRTLDEFAESGELPNPDAAALQSSSYVKVDTTHQFDDVQESTSGTGYGAYCIIL
jgi:serine/threonine protein kinase